jgi:cysteinyl-tRNA synthetase
MHNGFVRVDNEKMSKSLGNFFTIRDVLKRFDAEVIRFFILRAHYRSPLNYSDTHLEDARQGLARLYTALGAAGIDDAWPNAEQPIDCVALADEFSDQPDVARAIRGFGQAMDDDFNTPVAIATLFDLAGLIHRTSDAMERRQLARVMRALASVVGILYRPPDVFRQSGAADMDRDEIEALIAERAAAKKAKDFARADAIRADLLSRGVVLEDGPGGTTWKTA